MNKFLVFLAVFLLLNQINSATNQITDNQTYSEEVEMATGGTVISIPANALRQISSLEYEWTFFQGPIGFYYQQQGAEPFMQYCFAPLYLPHKAIVKKLVVAYTDNGSGADDTIEVSLLRSDPLAGISETLAQVTTDIPSYPSSPNRRILSDNTINYSEINNHRYVYSLYVYFWLGSERVQFHGAKIILE